LKRFDHGGEPAIKNNAYPMKPVRTEADYQAALQLVAPYFDNEPEIDSDAGAHFEAMLTLIEAYEAKHYPVGPTNQALPTTESRRSNQ
jgi:antitoxin component HigA of HigAB toxin-antitoxin module